MDPKELETLSHLPLVYQLIGGLFVSFLGGIAIWKAYRDVMGRPQAPVAPTVASQTGERDFAKMERDLLRRDLEDVMRANRDSLFVEIGRVERALVEADKIDRHEIKNLIHGVVKKFEEEHKDLEERIRDLEINRGPR